VSSGKPITTTEIEQFRRLPRLLAPQLPTPIVDWVEDNIRLPPSSPNRGKRFRHNRHPVSRPWFEAIQSRKWERYALTGPGQNGKSLMGFVLPVCYILFELKETVFLGIPDMRLAQYKWTDDFLPTIETSFPEQLPTKGPGSKGGTIKDSITFNCGSRIKILSARQGDAGIAGPTTRNLVMTEVDKYDTAGEVSREADPIRQMEARTNAFRDFGRLILMECTVSIPVGRIWQEITKGTDSRLYHPCPHCDRWITWEREHLVGWDDAEDEFAAADTTRWECPSCEQLFGEDERRQMHGQTLIVHRGQEVTSGGEVIGDEPRTETFGLRWSAFDNPFIRTSRLGKDEWLTKRAVDRDSAERAARQFIWAIPYEPPDIDLTQLDPATVAERQYATKRGEVPEDCIGIAVGVDTGKRRLHWSAHALRLDGSDVIIEYGEHKTQWETLGVTRALLQALNELKTYWLAGWRDSSGRVWQPTQVWIDSGYAEHQAAVYAFCKAAGVNTYRPTKGVGPSVYRSGRYTSPREKSDTVRYIGRAMHATYQRAHSILLMSVNADAWKAEFQSKLKMESDEPGAITLYSVADATDHADWCAQVTAERQVETLYGVKFEPLRRENHWLDAGYLATAAGEFIRANSPREGQLQAKPRRTLAQMAGRT
jgi:phage terminase large subunit GpA-like protein